MAQYLVSCGAGVNVMDGYGVTPLCAAALGGHTEVVDTLCRGRADVNGVGQSDGRTPLVSAGCGGFAEVARCLLSHGADPGRGTVAGLTPLAAAAMRGRSDIVALLRSFGAHVTTTTGGRSGVW